MKPVGVILISAFIVSCSPNGEQATGASPTMEAMNQVAEDYVKLALAMGPHDADYVDAYYGPEELKTSGEGEYPDLDSIRSKAERVLEELESIDASREEEMIGLRHRFLLLQLRSLIARARMLGGERLTFDEESQALYDATAPTYPESHFQTTLDQLDKTLPGTGSLVERYDAFRDQFLIPPDKLDAVFQVAIKECRARTAPYIELPDAENFRIEYVTDKSWSGYNWYEGNYQSLIQVNTDLPIAIDRAVDLACHEGYPGHHAYNVMREKHLVNDRGWVEFTVQPLFCPMGLISEGTANYGIDVAFPGEERLAYEKETLFPLAGLDPGEAELYYEVQMLMGDLSYAGNEAARRYLNGEIDADEAARWLVRYALSTLPRAQQRIRFIDQYRSYVINYNLGKDMVADYIEGRGGTEDNPAKRWREFETLLSSPRVPSGLKE